MKTRLIAHVISLVLNPGFLILGLLLFGVSVSALPEIARTLWLISIALAAVAAGVILLVTWAHGVVIDVDLTTPFNLRDRSRVIILFLAVLSFLLFGSFRSAQPEPLHSILLAMLVLGILVAAIGLVWKISLHLLGVGMLVTALILINGPTWWPIALLVPLVAWARLHLHRHTPWQLLAGLSLGALTTGAIFWWAGLA